MPVVSFHHQTFRFGTGHFISTPCSAHALRRLWMAHIPPLSFSFQVPCRMQTPANIYNMHKWLMFPPCHQFCSAWGYPGFAALLSSLPPTGCSSTAWVATPFLLSTDHCSAPSPLSTGERHDSSPSSHRLLARYRLAWIVTAWYSCWHG